MIKVEITNYESIKHAELIIDGFTTIIGRNGLGKSAVLRAINAALTNHVGTQCINWDGAKFCEVHIVSDTMDILWHKEEGNNHYVINGVKYEKIGRDPPPKVLRDAGYGILRVGQDEKINLTYSNQFHTLFLVDRQDSKGVDLITTVYGLDRLYKASDLCNKEQKANSDTLRMREKDLELLEEDLKKLDGLDAARSAMDVLEAEKKRIESEERKIQSLRENKQKLIDIHTSYKKLSVVSDVVIPDMDTLRGPAQIYTRLLTLQKKYDSVTNATTRLSALGSVTVPELKDVNDTKALCIRLNNLYTSYAKLLGYANKEESLKGLVIPKTPVGYDTIQKISGWLETITKIKQGYASTKRDMEDCEKNIEKTKEELKEYKACPTCGASLEGKF